MKEIQNFLWSSIYISAGLLISCLLQIRSVCSRFQAERLRKDMIKMAVNQQEILLSELRAIILITLKGLRQGILSYFDHRQNYL